MADPGALVDALGDTWAATAAGLPTGMGGAAPVATIGVSRSDLATLATGRARETAPATISGDVDVAAAALSQLPVTP